MTINRTRLPDRRQSVTQRVVHRWASGTEQRMLVTFSFDENDRVREIFCADFKAGTDMHTLIIDASILVSRLLQSGLLAKHVVASLCDPPSIVGSIARAAAALDEETDK